MLHQAKKSKRDEFYTQLCDIERELQYYPDCFRDKTVYCNCDDPRVSNFVKYFKENFHALGLRRLIASCYREKTSEPLGGKEAGGACHCVYDGREEEMQFLPLEGDGDFRSGECLSLLQQSDVVVTNPPFSLFREFVSQMIRYDKQFLIIGNVNAITYKEIFSLIQADKIWLGVNLGRGISGFIVPEDYPRYGTEVRVNEKGQTIVATNGCLWLTNLALSRRNADLELKKEYYGNEEEYPCIGPLLQGRPIR